MDHGHADMMRCELPEREPVRGVPVLRTAWSLLADPFRRDRRVVVYPIAVVMAVGIGVLGHVLSTPRPTPATPTDPVVRAPASSVASVPDRDDTVETAPVAEPSESQLERSR